MPVQNVQPLRMFQYKIFGQQGYSSASIQLVMDMSVQNVQPLRMFQYIIFGH